MKASLPIGSVVLLKDASKRIMIIGYYPKTEEGKVFDYTACLYPEGVIDSKNGLLFNHDDIVEIIFNGYVDDEQKEFMQKVNDAVKQLEQSNEAPTTTEQQVVAEQTPSVEQVMPAEQISPVAPVQPPAPAEQPVETLDVN